MAETIKVVSTSLMGLTVGCAQCHNHRFDPISHVDYHRLRAVFEPAYDWKNWRKPAERLVDLTTAAVNRQGDGIEAEAAKIDAEHRRKLDELIDQVFQREIKKVPEGQRTEVKQARETKDAKRTSRQKELLRQFPNVFVNAGTISLFEPQKTMELDKLTKAAAAKRASKPPRDQIMALTEIPGKAPPTHLFHRGDHQQPKQVTPPGNLAVLAATSRVEFPAKDPNLTTTGRRLAFAHSITDGKHPLLPRAIVNRLWMHHFGTGIVETPGDFGMHGAQPTHPELLDWLAQDWIAGGWKLKRIHKLLVTSTAYRQQSQRTMAGDAVDPDNRLLHRFTPRRLEAESVRDAVLAITGKLNRTPFGPPIPTREDEFGQVVLGAGARDGNGIVQTSGTLGNDAFRRSIYVSVRRSKPLSVLETFDAPIMSPNCERRVASTVAAQSLLLMNSRFATSSADDMAERLFRECGADVDKQVERAWLLAYSRPPDAREIADARAYLAGTGKRFAATATTEPKTAVPAEAKKKAPTDPTKKAPSAKKPTPNPDRLALASMCQALLASNEMLYVD